MSGRGAAPNEANARVSLGRVAGAECPSSGRVEPRWGILPQATMAAALERSAERSQSGRAVVAECPRTPLSFHLHVARHRPVDGDVKTNQV